MNGAASGCTAPSGRLRGRHPPSGYLFARTVESRLTAAIIDSTTETPHERARSAQPNKLFAPLRSLCVTPVRLRTPQFRHPVRHPTSAAPGDHKSRPYPGACLPSVSHALFPFARSLSPPTINPIFPAAATARRTAAASAATANHRARPCPQTNRRSSPIFAPSPSKRGPRRCATTGPRPPRSRPILRR